MKNLLDWFIRNPIAANLLMVIIMVGGGLSVKSLNNEFFPPINPLLVQVLVPYPGAGPLEVEEQICIKIEEAISDVEGIKEIRSTASQGLGQVIVEAVDDWDLQRLINDVKNRVDGISTFPAEAERPIVKDFTIRSEVVEVVVYGGDDEAAIKEQSLALKDRMMQLPGISQVELQGVRDYLVSVDVSEETLRAYNLSFEEIALAIRGSSLNLPAGQMRNPDGDIQVQIYGQDYRAHDFEDIPVITNLDGSQVTLGQIATIRDTFEEKNFLVKYEGQIAAKLLAKVGDNPDTIGTAEAAIEFINSYQMPAGFNAVVWSDQSYYLKDRLSILTGNSLQGLVLVFVLLLLFLRPSLAAWVASGIGVAYLGTIMMMPVAGLTINVVSTFSFLLILGIVVDDAIVVSENIYSYHEKGYSGPVAASLGVNGVSKPVVLAVLTTLLVFIPMLFVPGMMAEMFYPVPVIAIIALSFSLIEALLILPSHLAHLKAESDTGNVVKRKLAVVRGHFSRGLDYFSVAVYRPLLEMSLANRGATIAAFLAALMITLSLLVGGWLKINFMPSFEGETLTIKAEMQEGTGFGRLLEVQKQIESGLFAVKQNPRARNYNGSSAILDSYSSVDGSTVTFQVNLTNNDAREVTSSELQQLWREAIGEIAGVQSLVLYSAGFGDEKDINLRLAGPDIDVLRRAANDLKSSMGKYAGVVGINDSLSSVRKEIRIDLKPHAETLGLQLVDVARQVRNAFYGAEAQRIPLMREDVKVLVRYPKEERANIEDLVNLRIKLADGTLVPFHEVAEATFVPGYTTIRRNNRSRVVDVFADVVPGVANAREIVGQILKRDQQELLQKYPGVRFILEGDQREIQIMLVSLSVGLALVMMAIYALLAVEFRSYLQPFYILSAVPFGIAGAIIGHLLLGMHFSFPSGFGILATAGVVVNSNLVLIDRVNNIREEGVSIIDAMRQGTAERLRPILLTSLTTFFGLMPILLEESPSAAALIPMVVSLSFGVVFATTITLLMVPALYVTFESLKERLGFAPGSRVDLSPV